MPPRNFGDRRTTKMVFFDNAEFLSIGPTPTAPGIRNR